MRTVPTPSLSTKVATVLDFASGLVAAQIGYLFSLPFYHPIVISFVFGTTYALFKWKEQITEQLIRLSGPLQNKNSYDYFNKLLASRIRFKVRTFQETFQEKLGKKEKKPKEVYLFFDGSNVN